MNTDEYGWLRSKRGRNRQFGVCGAGMTYINTRAPVTPFPYLSVLIRIYPFTSVLPDCFLSDARVPLPITCGEMVCRHFNTGSGPHSEAPIPDSAEKPGQGRGICGGTMPQAGVGINKFRLATIGDGCFLQCKKQFAVNPFPQPYLLKFAEKCVSIFLEVQGVALPREFEGCVSPQEKKYRTARAGARSPSRKHRYMRIATI